LHEGPTIVDAWPISSIATTLIEFSDFQRPFCERFYRETLPLIDRDYIRTGKVRMVYRDFPLVDVRKDAQKAAETA
jgi:protein-disulfide isomerase